MSANQISVLLDTNVYLQDFHFLQSKRFDGLKKFLELKRAHLLMPNIVDLEIRNQLGKIVAGETNTVSKLRLVKSHFLKIPQAGTLERKLFNSYDTFLKGMRLKRINHENLDWEALISKAVNKHRPFKENGVGVQDAVIWQTAISYLKSHKKHWLFFVTDNAQDFGAKGKLHETLQAELTKHRLKSRLHYSNSLIDFLTKHAQPIEFINEAYIRNLIGEDIMHATNDIVPSELEFDTPSSEARWSIVSHESLNDYSIDGYYILEEDKTHIKLAVEWTGCFLVNLQADRELVEYDYDGVYSTPMDVSFQEDIDAWYANVFELRINKQDALDAEILW